MTTIVWNQARDKAQRYRPRLPPELEPPSMRVVPGEDTPACKTCGYIVHKAGCPSIKPSDPVQVEPKIYSLRNPVDNLPYTAPGGIVGDPGFSSILKEKYGQFVDPMFVPKLDNPRGYNFPVVAQLEHGQTEPRMYSQAEFEAMRQGLLGQIMTERTIANGAAQVIEALARSGGYGYDRAAEYEQKLRALENERRGLELQRQRQDHYLATLEMERDRMKLKPDFIWNELRGDYAAVRYGTPADEVRLDDRIAQAYAAQEIARQQTAQAQHLMNMAREAQRMLGVSTEIPMNGDEAAVKAAISDHEKHVRKHQEMRSQEFLARDAREKAEMKAEILAKREAKLAEAQERIREATAKNSSELDRYRALVHGDAMGELLNHGYLDKLNKGRE